MDNLSMQNSSCSTKYDTAEVAMFFPAQRGGEGIIPLPLTGWQILSIMASRINRPSNGPLQVQPSLLIPNPLLWSSTSRTTMPWPNIAYSAHHSWSFRPDCRNYVGNCCKALPVKEAPLPPPPQHSLAPTLMTNLADLIVTALNNKPVSKATHYVNNSNIVSEDEFVVFRAPWPASFDFVNPATRLPFALHESLAIFSPSKLPCPSSSSSSSLPLTSRNKQSSHGRHGRSTSKRATDGSSQKTAFGSNRNSRFNFGRLLRNSPPPVPPALLRLLGAAAVRKDSSNKLKVTLRVLPSANSNASNSPGSNYITVDGRQKQVAVAELYSGARRPVGANKAGALKKVFGFDSVFSGDDSLSEICSNVLFEVIQTVIAGEDSCILSFGHTGEGCCNNTFIGEDHDVHQVGVIPSAISWLYRLIGEQKQRTGARFSVRVSAVEISGPNEEVRDLLANKGAIVLDSASTTAHLQNASELRAPSLEKAGHYLDTALSLRKFSTDEERRNSHLIYTLHVYQYRVNQDGKGGVSGGRSRLHLIDLGPGEKCTKPNRSSLTLPAIGNVLLTLMQGQKHLPSKDSNLTKILKETIGSSQCKFVSILACVSPDSCRYMETMNTIQIISRLYRLKRTKKTPFGVGLNSSSGGDSSCEERQRRMIRRSISDPDCTTSSSEQSCDTVIFLGTPGVPFVAEPSAASNVHSHSSSTRILKPSSNSTSTAPQRPAHFLNNLICAGPASAMTKVSGKHSIEQEEWIDGPKAKPKPQKQLQQQPQQQHAEKLLLDSRSVVEQSKRERVREWIIRQETERLVNISSGGGGGGGSGAQPSITADDGSLSRSHVEEWNVQLARSSLYGSPEARYLEDIVEVEEDSLSEQYSSNAHPPADHCQKTKTLLHGITESISAAFSDSAGRLRILSTDDVDTRCSDSISICTASALADPVDEDVPSLSSDEDLELAMQASLSLSSVRSLDILQKLKAERAQQALLLNTPTQQPKPAAGVGSSFSIGQQQQQQQRLDPEGKERFACFEESVSTTTMEKSRMPAPVPVSQSGLLDEVEKRPSVVQLYDGGCCRLTGGDRMPPPTSGSYRQAIDLFEPVVCSGKGSKSQQLKFSQSISTRLKNCNSNASGGESKLPKLNLAAVGKVIKEKKSDPANAFHQVRVKSPLHLLLANARVPKFTPRGSHSPSQRTSSGYESGGHDSTVGLIVSPCPKQLTQPCRAGVARSMSSGRGSDNSLTPSSDSFIRPPRGTLHRTAGGKLSLGSNVNAKLAPRTQPRQRLIINTTATVANTPTIQVPCTTATISATNPCNATTSAATTTTTTTTTNTATTTTTTTNTNTNNNNTTCANNAVKNKSGSVVQQVTTATNITVSSLSHGNKVSKVQNTNLEKQSPQSSSDADTASAASDVDSGASASERSPKKRWFMNVIGRGFKSAPQSPGSPSNKGIFGLPSSLLRPKYFLSSRSSSLTREEMEKSKTKIDQLKAKQEALKVELRKAKERLGVPESKWCYDLHVLDCMESHSMGMMEAFVQETKILEKRVNACKSHVQLITVFDAAPSRAG
ncbi:Kinesin-like protein KIF26A [Trichinella zimbabwensis]|uniref:Kinesin-like protein KIF26A n=1 Tax=Trichinella zimbabwensis TaxID=268475 RepID=A0A0V1HYA8_9BILA|nr:Kinesin-like protein KIF26A [Trichinella zimbabwensis]